MATNTSIAAVIGDGSILRIGLGTVTVQTSAVAPGTNDLGIVQTISPAISHEPVDVTAIDSGGIKQYIAGLRDATLSFDVELDSNNDSHNDVIIAAAGGVLKKFAVVPTGSLTTNTVVYSGSAYVTDASMTIPVGDKQTMSVTLQVTGGMSTAAGT